MGTALDDLVDILDLERLEVNLFRGVSLEEGRTRLFRGQVLAQALVAAGRTVDSVLPGHSPHPDWLRAVGTLPDDPMLHAAIVAYASDFMLLSTATLPHASDWGHERFMTASLDHVMWFHRPCRADEWLLYHCHSPAAAHARGLSLG